MKKRFAVVIVGTLVLAAVLYGGNDLMIRLESDEPSESIGQTNNGRLVNGKRLPSSGANYQTYSRLGSLIGRTAVHHQVRDAVLTAYAELEEDRPELRFVYGETGWPWGGRIRPHRTHRNGLSVDFMTPVTKDGLSTPLPTHPLNKLGYAVAFDGEGQSGELQIDFEAIAAHLTALMAAGKQHGVEVSLVVFAPDLQRHLFSTDLGLALSKQVRFNVNPSWVRHDDHYHVDFILE